MSEVYTKPRMPPVRRDPKDRFAPYRRTTKTPSARRSPFTYVAHLYQNVKEELPPDIQKEIEDDVNEFMNIIAPSLSDRTTGDKTHML